MGLFEKLGMTAQPAESEPVFDENPPQPVFSDGIPPDPDFSDGPTVTNIAVEHVCENCGNDVQYSGRGRKPKHCPECRSAPKGSTATPRMPRMVGMDKRKAKIVDNLMEINGMLAGSLVMAAPVTGTTMALTAPPAIASLVEIASKYPAMLAGLEKLTEVMPWVEIARFGGAMAYAAAVDAGRLEPYGMVPEYLGVAAAAEKAGWQPAPEQPEFAEPTGVPVASATRFRMPDGA